MSYQNLQRLAVAPDPLVRDFALLITSAVNIDTNRDGKIDLTEGLIFGQTAIMIVINRYASFAESIQELLKADSERRKELIQVFNDNLDLPNDNVEELLEKTLFFIESFATESVSLVEAWSNLDKDTEPQEPTS